MPHAKSCKTYACARPGEILGGLFHAQLKGSLMFLVFTAAALMAGAFAQLGALTVKDSVLAIALQCAVAVDLLESHAVADDGDRTRRPGRHLTGLVMR